MSNREKYDQRRREFRQKRPAYYCPHCTSILYSRDEGCLECESARPPNGWTPLSEGFDPCLGRELGGRYLVTRFIGVGGTGNVYRAESLTILRQFAIKIIDANRENKAGGAEKIRVRLEREIEALSRLRNPHIVPFYEVLELPGNFLGVVMDYIEGTTLEDLVHESGPLDVSRTCKIVRQIATGIHEAHEANMTHRDLKPENIMIERLPLGDEFAHILDFGIVQLGGDNVRMTQGFLGTPLYASPEQAMGRGVDRRSDIYSLGAVLFFTLTGRPPFVGNNSFEVLDAHIRTPPPTLRDAYPERQIPEPLQDLVSRMLAKAPDDRPQDLARVSGDLESIQQNVTGVFDAPPQQLTDSAEVLRLELEAAERTPPPTSPGIVGDGRALAPPSTGELPLPDANQTAALPERARPPGAEILRRGGSTGKFKSPSARRTPSARIPALPRREDLGGTRSGTTHLNLVGEVPGAVPKYCAPTGDGRIALVDAQDGLWLIGPSNGSEPRRVSDSMSDVTAMTVVRSGILAGRADGSVDLVRLDTGVRRRPFESLPRDGVSALASDPGANLIVIGTRSGRLLKARGLRGKKPLLSLQHGHQVTALAVNHAADNFAVARKHGPIEIFNVGAPHSAFSSIDQRGEVSQMAFSKDGHILAVVLPDTRIVHLHHVFTGHVLLSYAGAAGRLLNVRFTDDSELVGISVVEGQVFTYDLQQTMVPLPR